MVSIKTNAPEEQAKMVRALTDALVTLPPTSAQHLATREFEKTNVTPVTPITINDDVTTNLSESISGDMRHPESLLQVRNGYNRLSTLATQMQENQVILSRGMRCAQSSLANSYHHGTKKVLGLFGIDYVVPDLRETVQLQLSHVRQYGACINEIVSQTTNELRSTHEYVGSLAKDILKLSTLKERLAPVAATQHSATYLGDLQFALGDKSQLESFLKSHDKQTHALLQRGDFVVADRAIQRKSEYVRHAYAVELLLIGSLTTAKQIAVDAGCYASMLHRLASAYFNLGCSATQMQNILGGLETMQKFTDGMQTSVAQGLERLDKALIETRTTIGPRLETAVYNMRS